MLEKTEKAASIAQKIALYAKEITKPGVKAFDIAETLEAKIKELGALPAFPINISINEIAAHFTPDVDDSLTIGEKDLVKIDVGAHIDGFVGDTAISIDLSNENGKLIEAAEKALDAAICTARAGVKTNEIGAEIEAAIKGYGFKPIENLTGHAIKQYDLHAGCEIPNVSRQSGDELKEGDIIAIEPFATNGEGRVSEGSLVGIFSLIEKIPVRMRESRRLLNYVENNFQTLPFAERWLRKEFNSKLLLHAALKELILIGSLQQYPILKEVGNGLISQAEATVLVEKDSVRVLTK